MTTKTETKTTEPPKLSPRVRGLCLPPDIDLPPAVAEANQAAIEAGAEMTAADADRAQAARQARGAARHDQLAAQAALEAGEPAPEPTEPAKVKRVADTGPRVTAAERNLKVKARALREAIRADEQYLADRKADHDVAHEEMVEALAALPEQWHRLLEARATYVPAKRIVEDAWSGPPYEPGLSQERREQRIEKALKATRARAGRDLPEVEQLIADLRFHLERAT